MRTNPVRKAMDSLARGRDRSVRHILVGLGVAAGAVALSALAARLNGSNAADPEAPPEREALDRPAPRAPAKLFAVVWPPLFMSLTLSGLRIWNAPRSAARTQALTLWGAVQALNAVWMALGPRRLGGQLAAVVASLGAAAAYVWRARRVDGPAAHMAAPYAGWAGVANVLTEELWRKPPAAQPTVH